MELVCQIPTIRRTRDGKLIFINSINAWHPDRLTRNKVDETRISELLDSGKLADLKFPTHMFVNDASGKYFLSIQMANAKYYIDKLSEDITRGQKEKLRSGALNATYLESWTVLENLMKKAKASDFFWDAQRGAVAGEW